MEQIKQISQSRQGVSKLPAAANANYKVAVVAVNYNAVAAVFDAAATLHILPTQREYQSSDTEPKGLDH
jgi:hypothetical protein